MKFKKTILVILILIGVFLYASLAGQKTQVKKEYWQDFLFKPNQAWIEKYGFDNDSQLAYNIMYLRNMIQIQQRNIAALDKKLKAKTETIDMVADPNEAP